MGAADEMKELKLQVEKLRERLDFMAPMLSLLTFTQDYFQRVECEASVQLMRLKNARLADSAAADGGAEKEKMDPHAVETARWLHTITDLMIGLGGNGQANRSRSGPTTPAGPGAVSLAAPSEPAPAVRNLLRVEPMQAAAGEEPMPGYEGEAAFRESRVSGRPKSSSVLYRKQASMPAGTSRMEGNERVPAAFEGLRRGAGSSASPPSTADALGRSSLGHGVPQTAGPAESLPRSSVTGPARLQGGSAMDSTLEFGGLALGRGTWANAYRQATGMRRDALRLLCTSGIVTERELADDLTVISEEHIDECVSIAAEMLQKWQPELGPPPQEEAKRFFEERLAALYMKRAPSPFGLN